MIVVVVGAACVGVHKAFPPPLPPGAKPLDWKPVFTEGDLLFMLLLLGAAIGGLVGFLLRPSVPVIGQFPFETVVTRGSNLTGIDSLLKGAAETSFNHVLVGVIIGAVLGWLAKQQMGKKTA